MEEKRIFFVKKEVSKEEIPKKIEVEEISYFGYTGRHFLYELEKIEDCENGFMKVIYKKKGFVENNHKT